MKIKSFQQFLNEKYIVEKEIKSAKEFREYAENKMKAAHGDNYDPELTKKVIDGIIKKADGDWGAAVGMLNN